MKHQPHEIQDAASALYDGGWRASDKEMLMEEHGMDEEYADQICRELESYEEREKNRE